MGYALARQARSSTGAYYEVAASPRGDLLLWYPGAGPANLNNATPGVLGLLSLLVNKIAFQGRWRVVVRQASEPRYQPHDGSPVAQGRPKRELVPLMQDLVARIEAGTFQPEQAVNGVVSVPFPISWVELPRAVG